MTQPRNWEKVTDNMSMWLLTPEESHRWRTLSNGVLAESFVVPPHVEKMGLQVFNLCSSVPFSMEAYGLLLQLCSRWPDPHRAADFVDAARLLVTHGCISVRQCARRRGATATCWDRWTITKFGAMVLALWMAQCKSNSKRHLQ